MSRREGGFFMRETFFVFCGTKPTEERKPCILQADTPLTLSVADAEAICAPNPVEMVSVTIDVSSEAAQGADVTLEPKVDRQTRTILFTGGMARQGDKPLMKATAVYRILPET
jgi:hypothetical protein